MKKLIVICALVLALIPSIVSASNTSMSRFRGIITISNNGTALTNAIVTTNMSSAAYVSNGYANSSFSNTAMLNTAGADVAFMPGAASDNWCLFVPTIAADEWMSNLFYTDNSTGGAIRYFPGTAGMTTTDNDTYLEPGDNFTIEQKGWFDTSAGASKNLVNKSGAISLAVSASTAGSVTGTVTGTAGLSQTLAPNGAGDLTNITTLSGAATHWQAELTNDGDTSYVEYIGTGEQEDTFNSDDGTIPSYAVIDSVTVHVVAKYSSGGAGAIKTVVRLGGVDVTGSHPTTAAYVDYSDALARPGGGSWAVADILNLQIGVIISHGDAYGDRVTQVYATVAYHYPDSVVTATSIASGEHTVTLAANSTNLSLTVDGVLKDNQTLVNTVINTSGNWTFLQNNVMPYMEYQKIWIGGNLRQHITWQYNPTAPYVFTDQASGMSNHATPTFRTSTSDADLAAALTSFMPISEARAPASTLTQSANAITSVPVISGSFTANVTPTYPGAAVIAAVAAASSTPVSLPTAIISGVIMLAVSLSISKIMRDQSGSGTLFIKIAVIASMFFLGWMIGVFDYWMPVFFLMIAPAIAVASRSRG